MANTGTINTYELVGVKEDISDIITNISPTKTPFQAMVGGESVHQTLYQWQEDSLQAQGVNAQVEGAAAPSAVSQPTVMRSNVTQILSKTASASGTTDAVKSYGRAKELAYQLSMRSAEIKRDLEFAFVGATQAAVTGSASVARQMASAQSMISLPTTYAMGATGGLGIAPASAGAAATISEAAVLAVLETCYANGAEPNTIMIKPGDSLNVAAFQTNGRTRFVENGQKNIVNVVDVYESPFGKIRVVMNRFQQTSVALLFEAAMWKKTTLRNWFRNTLAVTGDATTVQIVGEFGLKHRNFIASGMITNCA